MPQMHPRDTRPSDTEGYSPSAEDRYSDSALVEELVFLLSGSSVCDFGRDSGKYVHRLKARGVACEGYDVASNWSALTEGVQGSQKHSEPHGGTQYDAVISLGGAECVPKQYERVFLDKLTSCTKQLIVLSWGKPRQSADARLSGRSNSYVIYQMWRRGFRVEPRTTELLRYFSSSDCLRKSILVFSKRKVLYNIREINTIGRIIGADWDNVKEQNRSNSSLPGAISGKIARKVDSLLWFLAKLGDFGKILRYDISTICMRRTAARAVQTRDQVLFFPVCFTCGKHFRYLRLALISLSRWAPPVERIFIYVDRGDPLTERECERLKAESRYPVVFKTTRFPMRTWGAKVQISELIAYREVAKQMAPGDFSMKFDSDVLFLSRRIFNFVKASGAGAVGNQVSSYRPSDVHLDYMQGGCYFIGARELDAITWIRALPSSYLPRKFGNVPEDEFITDLLRRCGAKIHYSDFMYWNPALTSPGLSADEVVKRVQEIPPTAEVLHFEGGSRVDRSKMGLFAEKFFGPMPPPLNSYL